MVSNREIRQLFDTIKELGDIVKRQNAKLDSLSVELENACKEVAEVKTELQTVRHKLDRQPQSTEKENIHRGPVPKQLKVCANFCSSTVAIGVSFEASILVWEVFQACGTVFHSLVPLKEASVLFVGGERGLVVRALGLQAGGHGFKSSFLPLDGFVFGGPELNSCTLCK